MTKVIFLNLFKAIKTLIIHYYILLLGTIKLINYGTYKYHEQIDFFYNYL